MADPIVVAEKILLDAINKAQRKGALGALVRRGVQFWCDLAVHHEIPKDEWFRDFEAAYNDAAEHAATKKAPRS